MLMVDKVIIATFLASAIITVISIINTQKKARHNSSHKSLVIIPSLWSVAQSQRTAATRSLRLGIGTENWQRRMQRDRERYSDLNWIRKRQRYSYCAFRRERMWSVQLVTRVKASARDQTLVGICKENKLERNEFVLSLHEGVKTCRFFIIRNEWMGVMVSLIKLIRLKIFTS